MNYFDFFGEAGGGGGIRKKCFKELRERSTAEKLTLT